MNKPQPNPAKEIAATLFPALARAVVVYPDKLKVEVRHGSASSVVTVTPSQPEAGSCIGKKGRTIRSMMLLAKLVSDRHGWPVEYAVETGPGPNPPQKDRDDVNLNQPWNAAAAQQLLRSTLSAFLYYPADVQVLVSTARRTSWEIVLSTDEPAHDAHINGENGVPKHGDDAVAYALSTIFKSSASLCGQSVQIIYVRHGTAPEPQPVTAAGRHCKEVGMSAEDAAVAITKRFGKYMAIIAD